MIRTLRESIPSDRRPIFDVLATPTTEPRPDLDECAEFARALAETCRAIASELDPPDRLSQVRVPTQVIHGRGDRLVPFTEARRLMDRLPAPVQQGVTVTGMINHSEDQAPPNPMKHAYEAGLLFGALHRLVNTV